MSGILDAKQVGRYLGAHVETVRRMARKGEIPAFKVGKDWRFRKSTLDQWAESQHLRSQKIHALVVDDEEAILRLSREILERQGFRVSTVPDGGQALAAIQADPPDLVFMDLMMSGMSGPEILKSIREKDAGLPVIIITGYPDSTLMMEAMNFGPILVLPKPLEAKSLVEAARLAFHGARQKGTNPQTYPG